MPKIHSSAIVDPTAVLADDVEIGPLCVVEGDVTIGPGTKLIAQCHVGMHTSLGANNILYPFSSIGTDPEDISYNGELSYTKIGDGNRFREGVTVNRGTEPGTTTVIGNGCFLMANAHVAHNCTVGNNVIMVIQCGIAGHCEVGDKALLSGLTAIHQFCRVGRMAVLSGGSTISLDLPPYMIGDGRNGGVRGYNIVGMKRNGFSKETIRAIKDIYQIFFREGLNTKNAIAKIEAEVPQLPEVVEFLDFVKSSKRGVLSGNREGRRA